MGNSTMTYDQALSKAMKWRGEKKTYPEIAELLKKAGYLSPRTKKPVGELAVRHMIVEHGSEVKAKKNEFSDSKDFVNTAKGSSKKSSDGLSTSERVATIKKLLDIDDISDEVKLKLTERFLNGSV